MKMFFASIFSLVWDYSNSKEKAKQYSRTSVTRTLKGNEKQFELLGVRVIGPIEYPTCNVNN